MNKTEKNKKAVISIARKAITYFSKARFSNISVRVGFYSKKNDIDLEILVYDKTFNNKSFWFYPQTTKKKRKLKNLIKAIEKDDFNKIEEWGF